MEHSEHSSTSCTWISDVPVLEARFEWSFPTRPHLEVDTSETIFRSPFDEDFHLPKPFDFEKAFLRGDIVQLLAENKQKKQESNRAVGLHYDKLEPNQLIFVQDVARALNPDEANLLRQSPFSPQNPGHLHFEERVDGITNIFCFGDPPGETTKAASPFVCPPTDSQVSKVLTARLTELNKSESYGFESYSPIIGSKAKDPPKTPPIPKNPLKYLQETDGSFSPSDSGAETTKPAANPVMRPRFERGRFPGTLSSSSSAPGTPSTEAEDDDPFNFGPPTARKNSGFKTDRKKGTLGSLDDPPSASNSPRTRAESNSKILGKTKSSKNFFKKDRKNSTLTLQT